MSSFYDIPEIPEKERWFCFGIELFSLVSPERLSDEMKLCVDGEV